MPLTIHNFKRSVDTKIYNRGRSYWKNGMIDFCEWDASSGYWEAEVQGSNARPYRVKIKTANRENIGYCECSCPFSTQWDGWCKHIIAVLLEVQEKVAKSDGLYAEDDSELSSIEGNYGLDADLIKAITDYNAERKLPQKKQASGMKVELPKPEFLEVVKGSSHEGLIAFLLDYGRKDPKFQKAAIDSLFGGAKSISEEHQQAKYALDTAMASGEWQRYEDVAEAILEQAREAQSAGHRSTSYAILLALNESINQAFLSDKWKDKSPALRRLVEEGLGMKGE